MFKKFMGCLALAITTILVAVGCNSGTRLQNDEVTKSSSETNVLQIWWDKGYNIQEDEILQQIVSNWQQESGEKAEIKFYTADDIAQKTRRAIQAGNPPDILFSSRAEYPLLAWQGKLEDVSEVIEPVEQFYTSAAKKAAYLYNNIAKKRSYYSVPLHQGTIHIFYWKDLLAGIGKEASDIPHSWDQFWQFWQEAQSKFQQEKQQNIYGLGLPFSVKASDTYYLFEQILEAYNVTILDAESKLTVDNPDVRQGIIDCLKWYSEFFQQGYVPPSSLAWLDPDNNREFLNRNVLMTPNPTLSIATALLKDKEVYAKDLGTMEFPNKPDGNPMKHIVSVRQAVILAEAKNKQIAKEFLTYFTQPEIINNYLKSAGGRYLPVLTTVTKDSFWTNSQDLHISTATKTLTNEGQTRLFYSVQDPIYSSVLEENLWGQALNSIALNKISPEQAADEAIAQIKKIFAEWK
ncbi:MAG: ABC transporter substrate-binding protein [Cyanobacteria bacterium P01_A01_bin.40]